ncbi:MAG: hypothetical protein CO042_00785 [Parcubacteria group bacterium CG_4_9_14_0_2_um_filter_41_8]|nr:MAG: hypothetical protein AUJ34_00520 [Parcubacteria group bacterium CG1_02_41_12]PJC40989.1 MAG: hypothetical protein CO042_00785 [Parcubacteria group bacterium CG_4_9_14_0_2_um_filter_41_8]
MTKTIEEIKEKAMPILKKEGVKRSAIFGSVVRGEDKKGSDVDILVEPPDKMTFLGLIGLKHQLEDVLKKKVDLLTYNSVHPLLKDKIFKEQIQIYG